MTVVVVVLKLINSTYSIVVLRYLLLDSANRREIRLDHSQYGLICLRVVDLAVQ